MAEWETIGKVGENGWETVGSTQKKPTREELIRQYQLEDAASMSGMEAFLVGAGNADLCLHRQFLNPNHLQHPNLNNRKIVLK